MYEREEMMMVWVVLHYGNDDDNIDEFL